MTFDPSPGGSQEPPSFSQTAVDRALAEIEVATAREAGKPIIEATIGPAEVHTLGAPMQDEYVTVSRRIWHETCARCLDNELRAARLRQQVDDLQLEVDARDVIGSVKDDEHEALERRNRGLTRALWASQACCALAVIVLLVWRINV